MKPTHHDDHSRAAVKQARQKSPHPTARAEDFHDARLKVETLQLTGNGGESGMLSCQHRIELRQASERNQHFLNPIQSFWPTPSA